MKHIVELLSALFTTLLDVSLKGGLTFALVFLGRSACLALKQRRYVHLLWLILFFRLALPVDMALPVSPFRSLLEKTGMAVTPPPTRPHSRSWMPGTPAATTKPCRAWPKALLQNRFLSAHWE